MKLLRRWWHQRRIAHWNRIVASIDQTERDIPAQRAQALTYLSNARDDLRLIDRAPVSRAPCAAGPGKREGVNRGALISNDGDRAALLSTPFNRKVTQMRRQHRT